MRGWRNASNFCRIDAALGTITRTGRKKTKTKQDKIKKKTKQKTRGRRKMRNLGQGELRKVCDILATQSFLCMQEGLIRWGLDIKDLFMEI